VIGRDEQVRLYDKGAAEMQGIHGSHRVVFEAIYRSSDNFRGDIAYLHVFDFLQNEIPSLLVITAGQLIFADKAI
jgi:hypothetical protein